MKQASPVLNQSDVLYICSNSYHKKNVNSSCFYSGLYIYEYYIFVCLILHCPIFWTIYFLFILTFLAVAEKQTMPSSNMH